MGTALLSGTLASKSSDRGLVKKYYACVRTQDAADRLRNRFSQQKEVEVVCNDNLRALQAADVVILGFQPGDVNKILGDTEVSKSLEGKLIISMLAGVTCEMISGILSAANDSHNVDQEPSVVRVIPSIGAQINEACSLISETRLAPSAMSLVEWIFSQVGSTQIVSEDLLNTAVAISATSHALTVTAVDALTDGSVSRGIPRPVALRLTAECLRSASGLLLEKMTLEELKDSMSVPRGITTEAWIQLDAGHVRPAISQAVRHAIDYAQKMV
jgi:pyrroline-5-carboxylate reductase